MALCGPPVSGLSVLSGLGALLSCPSGPGGSHPTGQGGSGLRKGWGQALPSRCPLPPPSSFGGVRSTPIPYPLRPLCPPDPPGHWGLAQVLPPGLVGRGWRLGRELWYVSGFGVRHGEGPVLPCPAPEGPSPALGGENSASSQGGSGSPEVLQGQPGVPCQTYAPRGWALGTCHQAPWVAPSSLRPRPPPLPPAPPRPSSFSRSHLQCLSRLLLTSVLLDCLPPCLPCLLLAHLSPRTQAARGGGQRTAGPTGRLLALSHAATPVTPPSKLGGGGQNPEG